MLKNIWGDPVEAEMLKMRAEQAKNMQNNAYNVQPSGLGQAQAQVWGGGGGLNNVPSGVGQTLGIGSWQKGVSPEEYVLRQVANTNEAMSRVHDQMQRLQTKVEMLTGFYTWMTQMYPDLIAQHKAMCDLYAAANPDQSKEANTGGMK
jgi:hypothetical protein